MAFGMPPRFSAALLVALSQFFTFRFLAEALLHFAEIDIFKWTGSNAAEWFLPVFALWIAAVYYFFDSRRLASLLSKYKDASGRKRFVSFFQAWLSLILPLILFAAVRVYAWRYHMTKAHVTQRIRDSHGNCKDGTVIQHSL
ncbi:hypothetical protein DCC81_16915 [Chitinophaga parva]|uniref:Uncharacterized protein n=2 Tax=Chitinophaga parva TaxID=2169414 RepID=A0A2T7BI18_9BACT|nr:hypothetical protein DCC81_16915 [Chitinophaga parva]